MPTNLSCIIVDSDQDAIDLLADNLRVLYNKIAITGTYTTWSTAMNALKEQECDLVFLDISMPGKKGKELIEMLPDIKSEVIFVTAHTEYALTAFKFSPSGYVLKPIDDKELTTAVDKAIGRIHNKKIAQQNLPASIGTKVGIPNKKGVDYISLEDIIYIEAINNYTNVTTRSGEIISTYNLTKFRGLLEHPFFYPIHRSYIVNMNYIKRYIATGTVIMNNGSEIPISKSERDDFLIQFEKITKSQS